MCLLRWLSISDKYSTAQVFRTQFTEQRHTQPNSAVTIEIVHLLWTIFASGDLCLNQVFRFHGSEPSWAAAPARLVLMPSIGGRRRALPVAIHDLRRLLQVASGPEEVLHWLTDPRGVPFLQPDPAFGATVLLGLSIAGRSAPILACLQTNEYSTNRKAVATLTPSRFYNKIRNQKSSLLCPVLRTFPGLQVPTPSTRSSARIPKPNKTKHGLLAAIVFPKRDPLPSQFDEAALVSFDWESTDVLQLLRSASYGFNEVVEIIKGRILLS